jgi:restriction system protein
MAIPDYQTLMLPVLEHAAQGETSVQNCIAALAKKLELSDDERSELLPSGRQTVFANRVHWAKTYLV